jgi:hypothetical protein
MAILSPSVSQQKKRVGFTMLEGRESPQPRRRRVCLRPIHGEGNFSPTKFWRGFRLKKQSDTEKVDEEHDGSRSGINRLHKG